MRRLVILLIAAAAVVVVLVRNRGGGEAPAVRDASGVERTHDDALASEGLVAPVSETPTDRSDGRRSVREGAETVAPSERAEPAGYGSILGQVTHNGEPVRGVVRASGKRVNIESGAYTIERVPAGTVRVTAALAEWDAPRDFVTPSSSATLELADGQRVVQDFDLVTGTLSGFAFHEGGEPATGVLAWAVDEESGFQRFSHVGDDGAFSFELPATERPWSLAPSLIVVNEWGEGMRKYADQFQERGRVVATATLGDVVDLRLPRPVRVVLHLSDATGAREIDRCQLNLTTPEGIRAFAQASHQGDAFVATLLGGRYTIDVQSLGYELVDLGELDLADGELTRTLALEPDWNRHGAESWEAYVAQLMQGYTGD